MSTSTLCRFLIPLTAALVSACNLAPRYRRPPVDLPPAWSAETAAPTGERVDASQSPWWQAYGSAELDALIRAALAHNHDLAAAVARIEQTRATVRISRAALLPSAAASASASRSRQEEDHRTSYGSADQAQLSVGYELDLWGKNRRATAAARAELAASVYDHDAVALVLQADVATYYFQVLALRDRLQIAHQNLSAAQQLLDLVQVRFDNGAATALDIAQQKSAVLNIESQIPALQQSLATTEHALAVLLGRPPGQGVVIAPSLQTLQLPAVATIPPAALLDQRPDIRAAEASLIAANADIGSARAELLPSLNLSASAAASGLITSGSGTTASVAAAFAQTLFDGGARRAQVQVSRARRRILTENYLQAVLASLQDVQDSLVQVSSNATQADILKQVARHAAEAYDLARIRYDNGAEDLLTLLDAQRTRLNAQDSLLQAQLAEYVASASVFKAVGGGWREDTAARP